MRHGIHVRFAYRVAGSYNPIREGRRAPSDVHRTTSSSRVLRLRSRAFYEQQCFQIIGRLIQTPFQVDSKQLPRVSSPRSTRCCTVLCSDARGMRSATHHNTVAEDEIGEGCGRPRVDEDSASLRGVLHETTPCLKQPAGVTLL